MLAVAGLSACTSTSTGDKGYVVGGGVITKLSHAHRKTPGPVSGTTLDGKRLSLAQYAGKVVVVNVWGSWCADCRAETGRLTAAARALQSHGVRFVGINTKDSSAATALAYQRHFAVPYPSLFDPSGRTLLAFHGTLSPNAIPSTVVIDQHGKVAASVSGEVPTTRTLVDLVEDVQGS